jgi:hypothetical protein
MVAEEELHDPDEVDAVLLDVPEPLRLVPLELHAWMNPSSSKPLVGQRLPSLVWDRSDGVRASTLP